MEKLAVKREQVKFDISVDGDGRENRTSFGEKPVERRRVQLPRMGYKKKMTYEELREWYIKTIQNLCESEIRECDVYREMTPEQIERNIMILWEEALSETEWLHGFRKTTREFSPKMKKIVRHYKYVAEHFDEIWDEVEEEWQKKKEKHNIQAAAVENQKAKAAAENITPSFSL